MTQESKSVTVNAATLREALGNVAPHASKGDVVPVLDAVRIETDGLTVTVAATDRYTLAAQTLDTVEPGDEFATVLASSDVARVISVCKDVPRGVREWPVKITASADLVVIDVPGFALRVVPVGGEFPRWRTLLDNIREQATSDENTVGRIAWNPQLLAKFAKATVDGRKASVIRAYLADTNKPTYLTIGETFHAAIMPIRQDWPELTAQPVKEAASA